MQHTHVRVTRYATCVQWTGDNTTEIIRMFADAGDDAARYGDDCIMIRFKEHKPGRRDIETIHTGWWLRKGEDGSIKCLPDNVMKMMYVKL